MARRSQLNDILRFIEQTGGTKYSTTHNWVVSGAYNDLRKPYRYNDVLARTQEIQKTKQQLRAKISRKKQKHTKRRLEQTTTLETLPLEKITRLIQDITKIIKELESESPRQRKKWYQFWK